MAGLGVHVALLRGVNVGGNNKLPMKELVDVFARLGCADVRTYIQSGNVVYRAPDALARRLPALATAAIAARFGLEVPIVARTALEIAEAARQNPFMTAGVDVNALHLAFLGEAPATERVAALDPGRSPPDAFAVRGRDLYLHLPNGAGRSKLGNAYFDRVLRTVSTMRNWRTVLRLVEMSSAD